MNIPFVDLKRQYNSIKKEIDKAVKKTVQNALYIQGAEVRKLECDFAEKCGVKHAISVGNGTDALFIALKMLNIGIGDEVIVPAMTFIATSEAVTMTGAKPVFADISPDTYTIDPAKIKKSISKKTKAIIPVHLYGQMADMDEILNIAKEYNIKVVEDAAQAHFAGYKNKKAGSFGEAGCFSFYPGKNLGAYGDGGMITTASQILAERIRMFANHGRIKKYDHEFEGVNSRLDEIQASVLNVKMKYIDIWNEKRNNNAMEYKKHLDNIPGIILPYINKKCSHVFHLFVIRIKERDRIREALRKKGISTGIHYPKALHNLDAYKGYRHKYSDFPAASMMQESILSLPMFPELTSNEIKYTADTIKNNL